MFINKKKKKGNELKLSHPGIFTFFGAAYRIFYAPNSTICGS